MSLVGIRVPKSKGGIISLFVLVVVIIVAICSLMLIGKVSVKADADGIVAKGTLVSTKRISYNDIKNVVLRDNFDVGSKKSGLSTFKVAAGKFQNNEFGDYTIYADTDCKQYVIMTLKDNKIIVVNSNDTVSTKALYDQIKKNL